MQVRVCLASSRSVFKKVFDPHVLKHGPGPTWDSRLRASSTPVHINSTCSEAFPAICSVLVAAVQIYICMNISSQDRSATIRPYSAQRRCAQDDSAHMHEDPGPTWMMGLWGLISSVFLEPLREPRTCLSSSSKISCI